MKFELIPYFLNLKDYKQFAFLMTLIIFIFGIYWYSIPIAASHLPFYISAPLATYPTSKILWKIIFKKSRDYTYLNLLGLSVILTIISTYLNFLILDIIELIKTGKINPLLNSISITAVIRMFVSFYYVGILNIFLAFFVGMIIFMTSKHTRTN